MCAALPGNAPGTLIIILGPTAAGKTQTAISLAEHFHSEIISADSRQFFRELRIGSAMPSPAELSKVPHYFIGHLSVHDYYNVSRYETDALQCLETLFKENPIVFMCGGSGLYINAVCHGIDELPDPDENIRKQLIEDFNENGIKYLQNELFRIDADYYKTIDLNNPARLIRAIEVCRITGKPYSSLRTGISRQRPFHIRKIGLHLPKDQLLERIRQRTMAMIAAGLEEEAHQLYSLRHLNALKTVGYTEMFSLFEKRFTREEAIEKIITHTWRYAKRQLTWFRREKDTTWFDPSDFESIKEIVSVQV